MKVTTRKPKPGERVFGDCLGVILPGFGKKPQPDLKESPTSPTPAKR